MLPKIDGHYIIQNFVRRPSDEAKNLRVIENGVTWSTLVSDIPQTIELRDGGELWAGPVLRDDAGHEFRESFARVGTWTHLPNLFELKWPGWTERLVAKDPKKHPRAPAIELPRGRRDADLGLLVLHHKHWRSQIQLEGKRTDISLDDQPEAREAMFARAREVVAILRTPTLSSVKLQLANDVYPEYEDYMRALNKPAQPTPDVLARSMHVYTIAVAKDGIATLWFGYVLGEHSILGIMSRDCTSAALSHP